LSISSESVFNVFNSYLLLPLSLHSFFNVTLKLLLSFVYYLLSFPWRFSNIFYKILSNPSFVFPLLNISGDIEPYRNEPMYLYLFKQPAVVLLAINNFDRVDRRRQCLPVYSRLSRRSIKYHSFQFQQYFTSVCYFTSDVELIQCQMP